MVNGVPYPLWAMQFANCSSNIMPVEARQFDLIPGEVTPIDPPPQVESYRSKSPHLLPPAGAKVESLFNDNERDSYRDTFEIDNFEPYSPLD